MPHREFRRQWDPELVAQFLVDPIQTAMPTPVCTSESDVLTEVCKRRVEHVKRPVNWRLHLFMLAICASLVTFSLVGSWVTAMRDVEFRSIALTLLVLLPLATFPAVLWHDVGKYEKRDAALTLPWIVSLAALIPFPATLSARMRFPLRDALLVRLDHAFGFSVPAAMQWAAAHGWVGTMLDHCYPLLFVLIITAALFPALTGRKNAAENFILANGVAFLFGLPVFTLFPAIGPWVGYHFGPSLGQRACELSIRALHSTSQIIPQSQIAAVVTFPSFHVVWATLSAVALWSIKWLRIPASLLAALIVLSTVTTGWHYGVDVLGGLFLAGVSLLLARTVAGNRHRTCIGTVRYREGKRWVALFDDDKSRSQSK